MTTDTKQLRHLARVNQALSTGQDIEGETAEALRQAADTIDAQRKLLEKAQEEARASDRWHNSDSWRSHEEEKNRKAWMARKAEIVEWLAVLDQHLKGTP